MCRTGNSPPVSSHSQAGISDQWTVTVDQWIWDPERLRRAKEALSPLDRRASRKLKRVSTQRTQRKERNSLRDPCGLFVKNAEVCSGWGPVATAPGTDSLVNQRWTMIIDRTISSHLSTRLSRCCAPKLRTRRRLDASRRRSDTDFRKGSCRHSSPEAA